MPNKITCIIFDFDGVIANTDQGRFNLLKTILSDYNINLSENNLPRDLNGLSTKAFLLKYYGHLSENNIQNIIKKRHELFLPNLNKYCLPYKGMEESIELLSTKYDLAIATTNSKEIASTQLKHLGVYKFFKWVLGREVTENKNFEKTYAPINKIINKTVQECIVIEDSEIGVVAARNEEYYCIRFDPKNIFSDANKTQDYSAILKSINIINDK